MGGKQCRGLAQAAIAGASLDPELATSLGYGNRTAKFAPILAALDQALRNRDCCRYVGAGAPPGGAP